jgi:flagellar motor switch protein FliM
MEANAQVAVVESDSKLATNVGAVHTLAGHALRPMEEHPAWSMIGRLPVAMSVAIPMRGLKVRDLLDLRYGKTVGTSWAVTEDVPLKVGAMQLCWGEFEVVEQKMALRLTRLA